MLKYYLSTLDFRLHLSYLLTGGELDKSKFP